MRSRLAQLSRSKAVLTALVALVVAAVAGTTVGYAALTKDVTLTLDGRTTQVSAIGGTVGDVLAAEGIEVTDKDLVAPAVDEPVADGSAIAVQFGRPLELAVDGETQHLLGQLHRRRQRAGRDRPPLRRRRPVRQPRRLDRTQRPRPSRSSRRRSLRLKIGAKELNKRKVTGADRRRRAGVDWASRSTSTTRSSPALDTEITDGDKVVVTDIRVATRKVAARGRSTPPSIEREDPSMFEGEEEVVRDGRDGVRNVTYHLRFVNGELAARKVVSADVRVKAVPRRSSRSAPRRSPRRRPPTSPAAAPCGTRSRSASPAATGPSTPATATTAASSSASAPGRPTAAPAYPHQTRRETQIAVATRLRDATGGYGSWPGCAAKLGLPR